VNNGQHIPLSCQAHISGVFAHVFADTRRQSCTTAQAALFQGICNVQSVQGIFTSELYSQNIPEQSTVQSANNTRTEITANLVVLNLVVKIHNVRSQNYYIKSDSTSVWKLSD
jgi:hypothetical protein